MTDDKPTSTDDGCGCFIFIFLLFLFFACGGFIGCGNFYVGLLPK